MENGGNTSMRTTLSKFAVASAAAVAMTLAVPVAAHAEPTGQYTYVCVLTNGSSYTMKNGEKLGNCKGSYLKKYINGNQVDSVHLAGNGEVAKPLPAGTISCLIAIYGTGKSVLNVVETKGKGWSSWVGAAISIKGLKACVA